MDDLIAQLQQIFPNATIEEIQMGLQEVLQEVPDADPQEILRMAVMMRDKIENGEFLQEVNNQKQQLGVRQEALGRLSGDQ